MLVTEKQNFTRGDKASASVRLRSKNKGASSTEAAKKKNRHSGDFSFFKHHHNNNSNQSRNNGIDQEDGVRADNNKKDGGDWAYITFQDGVPTVQDIKTNVGPVSAKEPVGGVAVVGPVVQNGATPVPRPVKVVNHQIRQTQLHQNKRISGDFSMYSPPPPPNMMPVGGPAVGGGQRAGQMPSTPTGGGPYKQQVNRGRGNTKANVTQVIVPPQSQHQPHARPNVIYRRKNDQNTPNGGVALHGGAAKRCSGEFDFSRNNRRSVSDYGMLLEKSPEEYMRQAANNISARGNNNITNGASPSVVRVQVNYNQNNNHVRMRPKSMAILQSGSGSNQGSPDVVRHTTPVKENKQEGGVMGNGVLMKMSPPDHANNPTPRQVGLGRRAVTQINIKKNSYNSAMFKSQENLVKSKLDDDPEELEDFDDDEETKSNSKQTAVKKGLLWQQRDKLFSQWKERYFILTPDYLQCFKKGSSRMTEMGEFIFKIKLCDIEEVDLLDRRGYLVISITLSSRGEGKIYLRKTEGIRDWFNSLKECVQDSKKRRTDRVSNSFWSSKQLTDSSSIEKWLMARKKIGLQYAYLNGDSPPKSKDQNGASNDPPKEPKGARSEITLDELDDLYRSEEAEQEAEKASKRLMMASHNNLHTTSIKVNSSTPPPIVRMRSRDDVRSNNKAKKINRLSLMSDIGLPDFSGQDLGIDLDKGIFVRKGKKSDNDSNDSGNNSMNTNGSVGSSNSSHSNSRDQTHRDERLETHLEADQSEDENEFIENDYKGGSRRLSGHGKQRHMGLQITHV